MDALQETGALIKSMLGNYYGVSLSDDFASATRKIETALFDVVVMELERVNSDVKEFITKTKELLPNLPIIIISEHQDNLQSLGCFKIVPRPFRFANMMQAISEGIVVSQMDKTATYHRSITYQVEISQKVSKVMEILKATLTDLSTCGMLVEPLVVFPGRSQDNEKKQFQDFFRTLCPEGRVVSKPLQTRIILKEEPLCLETRLAFIENTADDIYKKAGLRFQDNCLSNNRLMEILKSA
jgi:CheY-like chemotaxis protein